MRWIDRYINKDKQTVYVYDYGDVDENGKPVYRESLLPPDKMPKTGHVNIICFDLNERNHKAIETHLRDTTPTGQPANDPKLLHHLMEGER